MDKLELQKVANEVRKDIVTAVHAAKAGHPGGSLSAADVFTYLYFEEMNIDPKDPKKADRDRFVLSKGHTAPGLYSVLAERGYFPKEDLKTLRHLGSYLQGHPDMKHIPGVDMSSGSLGQGISAAAGMALSAKLSNDDYRVYTLLGDGEIEEGQVWEAAMFAGFRKLDNLVVIVDNNGLQIDVDIADVCSAYPIDKKFEVPKSKVVTEQAPASVKEISIVKDAGAQAAHKSTLSYDSDPRIRTGAYMIVGVSKRVKLQKGQTLKCLSKFYLGEGMECYVEAVNNYRELKAGDMVNIPALKLKPRKR